MSGPFLFGRDDRIRSLAACFLWRVSVHKTAWSSFEQGGVFYHHGPKGGVRPFVPNVQTQLAERSAGMPGWDCAPGRVGSFKIC